MKQRISIAAFALSALLLAGCATKPTIEPAKLAKPKSVVIADIPDIRPAAIIQPVLISWPQDYFSHFFDSFFDYGQEIKPAWQNPGVTPYNQNLTAGVIEAGAASTERKAVEFPSLVRSKLPGVDFRADFMRDVRQGLEAKGMQVKVLSDSRTRPVRLRWPAPVEREFRSSPPGSGEFANTPPVDADLLVQVAPVAIYSSPGPLNSYSIHSGVAVAIYNGRTKEFLGWQAIPYEGNLGNSYPTYDGLVADIDRAAPALHKAFMSLVPQVVQVISGGK